MASFTIPKNYSAPDGVKEGAEFSDIATFKIEGGKIHILTIGEDATPVSSKEDKSDKPKGGKAAIKEQLSAMEDKSGSESMKDESYEEEEDSEEEMD
jgi:hypothetical protein